MPTIIYLVLKDPNEGRCAHPEECSVILTGSRQRYCCVRIEERHGTQRPSHHRAGVLHRHALCGSAHLIDGRHLE